MQAQEILDHIRVNFEEEKSSLNGAQNSEFFKLRESAFNEFLEGGFPSTKQEEWKYTSFARLFKSLQENPRATPPSTVAENQIGNAILIDLENGVLKTPLNKLPKGLSVKFYSREDLYQAMGASIRHFLVGGQKEQHELERLNLSELPGILHIQIDKSVSINETILIKRTNTQPGLATSRICIELGENASFKLAELNCENATGGWWNNVVQVHMDRSSLFHHYKLQTEGAQKEIYLLSTKQEFKSNYHSYAYAWSGGFVRNDIRSEHLGERCYTDYTGLYVLNGTEFSDFHTLVDHAKPNCSSTEIYKGIVTDKARAVFNGQVMVREDAQKTNAYQSNRNILLSNDAQINAKPQLEIFADDVKCSHGATTGQIDENELYYLRSRGIGKEDARQMLLYAFAEELVQRVPDQEIRSIIESSLRSKLNFDTSF